MCEACVLFLLFLPSFVSIGRKKQVKKNKKLVFCLLQSLHCKFLWLVSVRKWEWNPIQLSNFLAQTSRGPEHDRSSWASPQCELCSGSARRLQSLSALLDLLVGPGVVSPNFSQRGAGRAPSWGCAGLVAPLGHFSCELLWCSLRLSQESLILAGFS